MANIDALHILVFGAGAVGSYIGGSLALAGAHVAFLERPESAGALAAQGLILRISRKEKRVSQLAIYTDLGEALRSNGYDACLFALKSYDTGEALRSIPPFQRQMPPVLCLQNGVENEARIASVIGQERVIAGTLTSAIARTGVGAVSLERLRGVGIAASHPLSTRLFQAFKDAGLKPRLYRQAGPMKWSKLVTNLFANASSAILGIPPAEIFADPRLFHLEMRQVKEALDVMAALNLPPVDLPGIPFRLLALVIRRLPENVARPLLARVLGGGRGDKMPSFYLDLQSGRGQSEVDYLNGAVVRFGERVGVPTPVNRMLTSTLLALVRGELGREEFAGRPEKLLEVGELR